MRVPPAIYLLFFISLAGCAQHTNTGAVPDNKNDSLLGVIILIDTNTTTLLSNKSISFFSLKDSLPATLGNTDIELIEKLLTGAVDNYNKGRDSSNLYAGFIKLAMYKRQYVPYKNTNGEKKVFINCFCSGVNGFAYWKTQLVEIEDGGSCFFNVTINLSVHTAGPLLVNGPA